MPQLRNIDIYNLSKLLTSLANNSSDAKTICDLAIDDSDPDNIKSLNFGAIITSNVTPLRMWMNIVEAAEKMELVPFLVKAALDQHPGDAGLASFNDELQVGFEKRVIKIAKAIKKNECVLFIGPELLLCKNGGNIETFNKFLARELSAKLEAKQVYFDERNKDSISYMANRFENIPKNTKSDIAAIAEKSFKEANIYKNIYEQIAALRFPLVISTNPDNILEAEYVKNGILCDSGYYNRSNEDKNEKAYDDTKSIIYKIFGSFEKPFSILFTDNDRVQFSKNVVKDNPAIPQIIKVLLENKYCLFLGFNFQEWHLKILIDCLGLTKADDEERIYALLMEQENESSIEHFEKNYKFYFINNQIEEFLDDVIKATQNIP
jgi:hypothetical protein